MYPTKSVIELSCAVYRSKGNQYDKEDSWIEKFNIDGDRTVIPKYSNKHIMCYTLDAIPALTMTDIYSVTDEDRELANNIIKHLQRLVLRALGDTLSDFNQRVFDIINKEMVTLNDVGVIACLPYVYFKDLSSKEFKKIILETNRTHIGTESEKISRTCAIIETRYVSQFECYSHTAITQTNELISWLNKNLAGTKGDIISITGKVKKHAYHWLHKVPETQLNYVKVQN